MGLVSLMRRTAQSLWMGIFILGLCSDVPTSFPSSLQEPAAARGKGSGPVGDQAISDAVEDELRSDSGLAECSIDARTRNGVVTLSGTVDHLLARRRAERVASTVRGVTDVVNEIVVRPPTRFRTTNSGGPCRNQCRQAGRSPSR
jgi:hypothetical protein